MTEIVAADDDQVAREFERLMTMAERLNLDPEDEILAILRSAAEDPLTPEAARQVLARVLARLAELSEQRGDSRTTAAVTSGAERLITEVVAARSRLSPSLRAHRHHDATQTHTTGSQRVELQVHRGIEPGQVLPRPTYAGRQIPMNAGFVPVRGLPLRKSNERIEIHVAQLEHDRGRGPSPDELVDIMLGRLPLPGVRANGDEFGIVELARSIANSGVRVPPIIDLDGTVLDGNRRLAACRYILESNEFDHDQRARAEWVWVWQLTEHADDEDRRLVVTGLNFEPGLKKEWPSYIKARKVHEHWQYMLQLEPRPSPARLREMKRQLSEHFALGPDTSTVSRYLKMVEVAEEFESHHVETRRHDPHEVKHASSRHFEYFDELSKGTRPGGVAYALEQDESFKRLVYDLLYDGKFLRFSQIRELKHAAQNKEIIEKLHEAAREPDVDDAQDIVEDALAVSRAQAKESRTLGANTRIKAFADWLMALPLSAFTDNIDHDNLRLLQQALTHVNAQAELVLDSPAE